MRRSLGPVLAAAALAAGCHPWGFFRPAQTAPTVEHETDSGVRWQDLREGNGATPAAGATVRVHYTGWLEDGTKFDSSLDRGTPFEFTLGAGEVIPGWEDGMRGMRVGGRRRLVIPPERAYGDEGHAGVIPPGATLVLEVNLLSIVDG